MGSKLGKMVKIIKISFVGIFSLSLFASDVLEKNIDLTKLSKIEDGDALVLTLNGSKDGLSLKRSVIKKPNYNVITKYKAFNKRDEFVLRVLDKNKTEVAVIGLGNPFYIHAQHIDHEESKDFGTYIDNQDINAVIPLGLDASYVVLASQDPFGLYDINEISLVEPLAKK